MTRKHMSVAARQARSGSAASIRKASERRRVAPEELAGATLAERRAMLADYLRLLSWWLGRPPMPAIPPRLQQVLIGLLNGRSEKQLARETGASIHTIHEYIKQIHRTFKVNSRGELLARFLPSGGALRKPLAQLEPLPRGRPRKQTPPLTASVHSRDEREASPRRK